MRRFLDRLRDDDPVYQLQSSDNGFLLVRRAGQNESFNRVARDLIDRAGDEFAVFPTPDGLGYERVFVVPI